MDSLQYLRDEIDSIDKQMSELFCRRMNAVKQVAMYKKENGIPVTDVAREASVIEKNSRYIDNAEILGFYKEWISDTMSLSKRYQQSLLKCNIVAYQGVEGAFSHIVLCRLFPQSSAKAFATWEDVFSAVENKTASYGVLPFENSQVGDVAEVLDLCFAHSCYICGMVDLPVKQNLLCVKGATIADIKEVYSHPQAISQCTRFLKSLGISAVPMENTAVSAKFVAEAADKSKAAIASERTAELYGLSVVASDINTSRTNTTRFIVIGAEPSTEGDRFSMLITVDHVPGSLARVIQEIARMGYNMESIKSRPLPDNLFEYYFYIELVGNLTENAERELRENLSAICRSVRILGRYNKKHIED